MTNKNKKILIQNSPVDHNRRRFVRDLAAAGLWASLPLARFPFSLVSPAHAADSYDGPFWVNLMGWGGWDVALMCDPKLNLRTTIGSNAAGIKQAGNIKFWGGAGWSFQEAFFNKYYQSMCVFNGVDTGTINHAVGVRYCATGRIADGSPSFAATVAAARAAGRPMSYLAMMGYTETAALISPTVVSSANKINGITNPNSGNKFTNQVHSLIRQASNDRLTQLISQQKLPSVRNGLEKLLSAHQGLSNLGTLTLPSDKPNLEETFADIGLGAFQLGLTTSMSMETQGFDTHSDNDSGQLGRIQYIYQVADYLMTKANADGVPVILTLSSDFGRTPQYTGNGTDHWPVTSIIVICSNAVSAAYRIPGNRVIGQTDANIQAKRVNVNDPTQLDPASGEFITPADVFLYLRKKAQIDTSPVVANYPLVSKVSIT